jgi:DNA (cytosine-5)-methyltransferase 1
MTQLPELMRMGLIEAPDVLVGGTPCQAFSVAGKRGSLDDTRGQLTLTYVDLLNAIDEQRKGDECVAVWENVPGVLNTKDNAFGCFLGELSGSGCELQPSGKRWGNAGCVFGPQRAVAWRVIDAQYFGVAQRRRRVFVVASARDGFDPTKILFESEGVRRDIAPSRETRKDITDVTPNSVGTLCAITCQSIGVQDAEQGHLIPSTYQDVSHCLNAGGMGRIDYETESFVVHGTQDPCVSNELTFSLGRNNGAENAVQSLTIRGRGCELGAVELSNTIRASTGGGDKPYVLAHGIPGNWIGRKPENGGNSTEPTNNISPCQTVTDRHAVHYGSHVRRLTPTECERLQGFPDGHTNVPHRGKPAADGPRYKAIGNSKAVPCIQWIGARLLMYRMGLI